MDRRTLLAVVLMMGIWFTWMNFFAPKPPEKLGDDSTAVAVDEPTTRPIGEPLRTDTARTELSSADVPAASGWFEDAGAELGESVRIDTDLFSAEFDRVGGDLVSYRLKRFRKQGEDLVELISARSLDNGSQRAHGLSLIYEDGRRQSLSSVTFVPSRERLSLGEQQPTGNLTLSAQSEDGSRLELELLFDNAEYGFETTLRHAGGESPVSLLVEWQGGVASSEPDSVSEYREFRSFAAIGDELHKKKFDKLRGNGGEKGRGSYDGSLRFAGVASQYFGAFVVGRQPPIGASHVLLDGDYERSLQTFAVQMPLERGNESRVSFASFLGPLDNEAMGFVEREPYDSDLSRVVNMGPSVFRPIAAATLWCLRQMYRVLPNYGWVIILFSAFTKLVFYPLTKSSTQSMKRMQEIQPELTKLKEKYKDDQTRQSQEMMALYKKHGVNPVGGCLPLLVQMPVFIVLFQLLRNTIELRQAPFIFWIDDLSRQDVLFALPFNLPVLGSNFSLLPFLMSIGMWWQTKLTSSTTPQGEGMMAMNAKMMGTMMPIMMFFLFYRSPSGLVLYWLVNTVLTAWQTWRIHQQSPSTTTPASA